VSTGFFLVGIDTTLPAVEWVEPREALEVVDIPVVVQHKRSKAGSSAMREQVFFFFLP
jgi:hypothetical protein